MTTGRINQVAIFPTLFGMTTTYLYGTVPSFQARNGTRPNFSKTKISDRSTVRRTCDNQSLPNPSHVGAPGEGRVVMMMMTLCRMVTDQSFNQLPLNIPDHPTRRRQKDSLRLLPSPIGSYPGIYVQQSVKGEDRYPSHPGPHT